jgi:hypothetical protein
MKFIKMDKGKIVAEEILTFIPLYLVSFIKKKPDIDF